MRKKNLIFEPSQGLNEIKYIPYIPTLEWGSFGAVTYSSDEALNKESLLRNMAQNVEKKYKGLLNWLFEDSILASLITLFRTPVL